MTNSSVAAALILAAVLCNSAAAQFRGFPQFPFFMGDAAAQLRDFPKVPFFMGDGADQFRGFPQGPFPTGGGAAGLSMPDWGGGSWMPGFPFSGGNGGRFAGGAMGSWKPWVVCSERGPCFRRRLTCPAKCFSSYGHNAKSSAWGGGGGCSFDCRRSCTAFC